MSRLLGSLPGALLAIALSAVVAAPPPAVAEAASNLSGEWHFDVVSQNGPGHREVLFRQDDQRVIGFIESDSASGRFVGRLDGANLEFTAVLEFGADFAHVHTVGISAFRMSRFLVTNAQYRAFSTATKHTAPLPPKGWSDYIKRYPNHPVINVNYEDATAYAAWLTAVTGERFRLPTEAEWEYAARSGSEGRNFVFGDEWQIRAANTATWHIGTLVDRDGWKAWWDREGDRLSKSQPMTTRVGSFAPTPWGLYDMVGNVWQWTGDWYQADFYEDSPGQDPAGPPAGGEKVLRGCSWYNQPDVCFIATRDRYAPDRRLYYNGFRVVAAGE